MELISKEETMQLLEEDYYASRSREDDERAEVCLLHFIDISNLPTVEERKEGHWVHQRKGNDYCSRCNRVPVAINRNPQLFGYKYCPYCGARMRGE